MIQGWYTDLTKLLTILNYGCEKIIGSRCKCPIDQKNFMETNKLTFVHNPSHGNVKVRFKIIGSFSANCDMVLLAACKKTANIKTKIIIQERYIDSKSCNLKKKMVPITNVRLTERTL